MKRKMEVTKPKLNEEKKIKRKQKVEKEESGNDTDSICSDATDLTDISCTSVLSNISSCRVDILNMKGFKDAKLQVTEPEVIDIHH